LVRSIAHPAADVKTNVRSLCFAAMPRVSEEHLEARRRQILDAARRRFTANGFHSTSMQDVLKESGLSAGAVYRYFASKEDIIGAIAEEAVGDIRRAFESGADDVPLGELIDRALRAVDDRANLDDVGRLALQVWAEAARSETLRRRIAHVVEEARAALRERIERQYGDAVDAEATAAVVTALLPGFIHAKTVVGDMDPERFRRGLDGLAVGLVDVSPRSSARGRASRAARAR
jgi:AcrR family transcriptional regulator